MMESKWGVLNENLLQEQPGRVPHYNSLWEQSFSKWVLAKRWWQACCWALLLVFVSQPATISAEEFKNFDIRVIRPKYFKKRDRFEIGAQFSVIMNETFIYTYMASGILGYNFTEQLELEFTAAYGINVDKEDKRILFDEFDIRTKIVRTQYSLEAAVLYTPIYGKWQLPSGALIYFDTYFGGGAGLTGVNWKYSDFCVAPPVVPADQLKSYPTILFAVGQRYFVSRRVAVRWDLRSHLLVYDSIDGECNQESSTVTGSETHSNVTLQVGASRYF